MTGALGPPVELSIKRGAQVRHGLGTEGDPDRGHIPPEKLSEYPRKGEDKVVRREQTRSTRSREKQTGPNRKKRSKKKVEMRERRLTKGRRDSAHRRSKVSLRGVRTSVSLRARGVYDGLFVACKGGCDNSPKRTTVKKEKE